MRREILALKKEIHDLEMLDSNDQDTSARDEAIGGSADINVAAGIAASQEEPFIGVEALSEVELEVRVVLVLSWSAV